MRRRMKVLTQTVRKLERKQKDNFTFKNEGIEKQAVFVQEMEGWLEDNLRVKLRQMCGLFQQCFRMSSRPVRNCWGTVSIC